MPGSHGRHRLAVGFCRLAKVHVQKLFRERFIYVARRDHPLLQGRLTTALLSRLQHVVADPPGTPHAAAVDKVLARAGVRLAAALRVRSFLCVGPIVVGTDLVAVVPSNLAALVAEHVDLRLIEPPLVFPGFDVSMVWHRRYHRDPAVEWLRATFVELFSKKERRA